MTVSEEQFIRELSQISDELANAFDEHLRDNGDDVLPHLYLADVTRRFEALVTDGHDATGAEIDSIIRVICDHFIHGDERIRELIALSFVENLVDWQTPQAALEERLGSELSAELRRQKSWSPK